MEAHPLISFGLPVRNGGVYLREAIDSILNQDYPNIELIISDNASDDETAAICQEYAAKDERITYHRQNPMLPAGQNFMFVLNQSKGDYFAWAAHDDVRSSNFCKELLKPMNDPKILLTFGNTFIFRRDLNEITPITHIFENINQTLISRIWQAAYLGGYHFYGLWRTPFLKSLKIENPTFDFSRSVNLITPAYGFYKHVPGVSFTYSAVPKVLENVYAYYDGVKNPNKLKRIYNIFQETTLLTLKNMPVHLALLANLATFIYLVQNWYGYRIKPRLFGQK
jgi:glycosyltransferase involved in cell wall biosynthesis